MIDILVPSSKGFASLYLLSLPCCLAILLLYTLFYAFDKTITWIPPHFAHPCIQLSFNSSFPWNNPLFIALAYFVLQPTSLFWISAPLFLVSTPVSASSATKTSHFTLFVASRISVSFLFLALVLDLGRTLSKFDCRDAYYGLWNPTCHCNAMSCTYTSYVSTS